MHQPHSKQWKFVMGFVAVVLLLGAGATLAQAAPGPNHSDLRSDHVNLGLDHEGLDQKLDQVLVAINNLVVGTPCGQGTAGQRFVVNGAEVCDNTTGLYWEQSPSASLFVWSSNESPSNAIDHCANLDLGNGQVYRLPEIKELISLVDYSVAFPGPSLPAGHPFSGVITGEPNVYWSAATNVVNPGQALAVFFQNGFVVNQMKTSFSAFAWCVR